MSHLRLLHWTLHLTTFDENLGLAAISPIGVEIVQIHTESEDKCPIGVDIKRANINAHASTACWVMTCSTVMWRRVASRVDVDFL